MMDYKSNTNSPSNQSNNSNKSSKIVEIKPIKYITFGSPLMDVIGDVDTEFLQKHKLKLNETRHEKSSHPAFRDLESHKVSYIPGGCSYNTIRIFNWMLPEEEKGYTGCLGKIGSDSYGKKYDEIVKSEGIKPLFEIDNEVNTGVCAVVCNNRDRVHLTDLGCSIKISDKYVESVMPSLKHLKLVYTELFILMDKKEIVYKLAKECLADDKLFSFNFPSFFFLDKFKTEIVDLIKHADVVFANEAEALHLAKALDFNNIDDLLKVAEQYAKLNKYNKKKETVFIITSGPEPANVIVYDHQKEKITHCNKYEPNFVDNEYIVDTNGAGDSFAGGFLSHYVRNSSIEKCVEAAHWAASVIIQKRGCDIPTICDFY